MKTRIKLLSLTLFLICESYSCVNYRAGDLRIPCRSNIDCVSEPYKDCLPLYEGKSLKEYCEKTSCPPLEGLNNFENLHQMVKVCDQDVNNNGIADITKELIPISVVFERDPDSDDYRLYIADDEDDEGYYEYYDEDDDEDYKGSSILSRKVVAIPTLFQKSKKLSRISSFYPQEYSCSFGYFNVVELGNRCLPPLLSEVYCNNHQECTSDEFCSYNAQCKSKQTVGSECSEDRECLSASCKYDVCIDRKVGSSCSENGDCNEGLVCTGQQTPAPGFLPTFGAEFCGDLTNPYSPCDSAKGTCQDGFICRETSCSSTTDYEDSTETEWAEICSRIRDKGSVFICMPNER